MSNIRAMHFTVSNSWWRLRLSIRWGWKPFCRKQDLCSRVRQHRFQCSFEEPTCFIISKVDDRINQCSNKYDEYSYEQGYALSQFKCRKFDSANCQFLKEYIKNSTLISNPNTSSYSSSHPRLPQPTSRISFRSYCDSLWIYPDISMSYLGIVKVGFAIKISINVKQGSVFH